MKYILKICLYILLCVLLLTSVASAQERAMQASWEADYDEDMNLVIKFKSPALYNQQVTAVMYPAVAEPSLDSFCRVREVTSIEGQEMSLTLKLGDDLTATDGRYKVKLQGNGILSSSSKEIIDVKILTPGKAASLLSRINGATIGTIAGILDEIDEELQIELADNPPTELMTTFLNVRNEDYGGAFHDLNEVRNAYKVSDIIVYLQSDDVTVDGLCEKVEKNASFLDIDITTADYTKYKSKVYEKVISIKSSYNNTGINTFGLLLKAIKETVAVEAVNDATVSELKTIVTAYKGTIGIADTYYNKYLGYGSERKAIVLRYIYNKNYTLAASIKVDFEKGVDEATNAGGGGGSDSSNSGSKPNDKGSFSGGDASVRGDLQSTASPSSENNFFDVNSSHWAYSFITQLNKEKILSGYPDGTFRPENLVTREEFVKMIVSAAGLYDTNAMTVFEDVPSSHWAYSFIASAKNAGIVNGVSESVFGAGSIITREDVAVITSRIMDRFNQTNYTETQGANTEFTDDMNISDYARASVKALAQNNIISGFEDGSFKPKDLLTRAQASKIIYMMRQSLS